MVLGLNYFEMAKTILVVEDDVDLLDLYEEVLQANAYNVVKATNGLEAISKYKKAQPDLVVMDGNMSEMDGYEAFSKIIKIDKDARVVIVTGYSNSDPKSKKALEQGLIAIISKPVGIDTLLDVVKKYSLHKPILKNNI
ncbi:CheY-like receiver [Candidatus Nitrosarchaeum limnium SFB1]|jgi:DNA-binding NtrC family response regulator|uniref:CheY-like receiver n=2 Tax=Candidatus Nitrosarchaeum limnium TaxID=1007084 RepID=F3KLD3_9ARCH|nr:CheY-like receiver [Candidatus Nitrosarchaeum limnium SFB1]